LHQLSTRSQSQHQSFSAFFSLLWQVQAAIAALRAVGELSIPPELMWNPDMDLLDWLGALFGFQRDNVRNQREHLVLLLANAQMQLYQDGMSWDKVNLRHATFCSFQRLWCNNRH
jgi:ferric iron reductase protein FhuF